MSNDVPYYEKDGMRFDRITRILDFYAHPDLVSWKVRVGAKEARRISTVATKIGTEVDEAIRCAICGKTRKSSKKLEVNNCWEAWESWVRDFSPAGLECVGTVFDEELGVAGTPDIWWPSRKTILDIKCAASIKHNYWLQTEFYGRQLGAQFKAILRLDKDLAMYEYKVMPLQDEHWAVVKSLVKAYRFHNSEVVWQQ